MDGYWGEIKTKEPVKSSIGRERMILTKPFEIKPPVLHQPTTKQPRFVEKEIFQLEPLTRHTIQLVQYSKKMRALIQHVRQQLQDLRAPDGDLGVSTRPTFTFPPSIALPEFEGAPSKHENTKPLPFLEKDILSDFARGFGKAPPEIDALTNRNLMRQSVAALCAHAGYDTCNSSVLDTLCDVTGDYMTQMTQLLRRAVDEEAERGHTGFPDAMERVFNEMGLGATSVLHDFYQSRVINYHNKMIDICEQLKSDYEKMKNPDFKLDDANLFKIKDEFVGDNGTNFPAIEDADESAENESVRFDGSADISALQNTVEDSKWPPSVKSEQSDTRVSTLDSVDGDGFSSEAGESVHDPGSQDPGSVQLPDLMSPPSIPPPKKKRKR